jgi:hypothetical protein
MERIKIASTPRTPSVILDADSGTLSIAGRSIMEYPEDFYKEILDGVDMYFSEYDKPLSVSLSFEYFNTASSKELYDLLKKLKGQKASVKWYYEEDDLDMEETGKDYEKLIGDVSFEHIPIYE